MNDHDHRTILCESDAKERMLQWDHWKTILSLNPDKYRIVRENTVLPSYRCKLEMFDAEIHDFITVDIQHYPWYF